MEKRRAKGKVPTAGRLDVYNNPLRTNDIVSGERKGNERKENRQQRNQGIHEVRGGNSIRERGVKVAVGNLGKKLIRRSPERKKTAGGPNTS